MSLEMSDGIVFNIKKYIEKVSFNGIQCGR